MAVMVLTGTCVEVKSTLATSSLAGAGGSLLAVMVLTGTRVEVKSTLVNTKLAGVVRSLSAVTRWAGADRAG